LKNATPATVSRAGILFINESDIGWRPFVDSWIQKRMDTIEKNVLPSLFDRFIDGLVEMTRRGYKEVTNLRLINKVSTVVYLLEGILASLSDEKKNSEVIENIFSFCVMWAFGGPMIVDKSGDYRIKFSEDFVATFGMKFPNEGCCFDYFFDPDTHEYLHWNSRVTKYYPVPIGSNAGETSFDSLFVETAETTRVSSLLKTLVTNGKYAMLVGNAGTGKSAVMKHFLDDLDRNTESIMTKRIGMSYYLSSFTLYTRHHLHFNKR
jgi:dynein heavy chain, axonemal